MFEHILVPLDGTRSAESVLGVCREMALRGNSRVTLVHVIESEGTRIAHGERHLHDAGAAREYLTAAAREHFPAPLQVGTHVHDEAAGCIAGGIAEHTDEYDPDLILMATHGEHLLRDVVAGTMAQRVAVSGSVPVMLWREPDGEATDAPVVLVPLDGVTAHENVLLPAATLAGALGALVVLLRVVKGGSQPCDHHAAKQYLQRHAQKFEGLKVSVEVRAGEVVTTIATAAREHNATVTAIATHGRSGMDAFWSGSVAARLLPRIRTSVLVVGAG